MDTPFLDPRGEYLRQCPYCLEYITVNHMNRKYCPSRNGTKDFCKNRFKRYRKELKKAGVKLDNVDAKPLIVSRKLTNSKNGKTQLTSYIQQNLEILENVLNGKDMAHIPLKTLKNKGYKINHYTSKHNTVSGFPSYKIGPFAVSYLEDNTVYIIYYKDLRI
jgi:hypothetical protein